MQDVVIFGTGMLAELAHVYLETDSQYRVAGFTVDACEPGESFRGLPVVRFEDAPGRFSPQEFLLFMPMSSKDCNNVRKQKFLEAKGKGYSFANYVSSRAVVLPETKIGDNCFILENNVVQSFATIGDNVVMWSGNHIGHHSHIGDHCFLTSHCVISGRVTVGERCFFGVNATIGDDIVVAEANIIGARALIMKNTKPGQVFVEKQTPLFPLPSDKINLV